SVVIVEICTFLSRIPAGGVAPCPDGPLGGQCHRPEEALAMIDTLLSLAADPALERHLAEASEAFVQAMRASARRGDPRLVHRAGAAVRADPRGAFAFDADGRATLSASGHTWQAGRFETPSLADLRQRTTGTGAPARLWVLDGASPATDIGSLQA